MENDKINQQVELAERSTRRMGQALHQKRDEIWQGFMKQESRVLLKRAWSIWWRVRWPRNWK